MGGEDGDAPSPLLSCPCSGSSSLLPLSLSLNFRGRKDLKAKRTSEQGESALETYKAKFDEAIAAYDGLSASTQT